MLKRRSFLTATVGTIAGFTSVSAHSTPLTNNGKWNGEYDVIIIGAGGAGLAAAVEAAKTGNKVLVLEKTSIVGGSSLICGGKWATSGSEQQKAKNIQDSEELFIKDMIECGLHKNDPELVKTYVKASNSTWDWLHKEGKIEPKALVFAGGQSVPRSLHLNPPDVIAFLKKTAEDEGVKIELNTKAERLLWSPETNRINGVRASHKENELFLKANKGVVLAAGGFAHGPDMLEKYAPQLVHARVRAGMGTQGDGIKMAQAYGADIIDTNFINATYGYSADEKIDTPRTNTQYHGGIALNKDAKRFGDESVSYKLFAKWALSQPDGKTWLVFDDKIRRAAMEERPTGDGALWAPIDKGEKPSYVFYADTIEEAAQQAGLDPKAAAETVRKYNSYVDADADPDFGRKGLSGAPSKLVKIDTPPFFFYPATGIILSTYCGVKINPKTQVIDVFGEPIPGLFAAGEMTGGVHGAAYMNGTAFSKAVSFGRIAGQEVGKA